MDRLTTKAGDSYGLTGRTDGSSAIGDAITRLASYEDTGLTPDEVKKLAKRSHDCKITCLLTEYEKLEGENAWLRAEVEVERRRADEWRTIAAEIQEELLAAKMDRHTISGEYKICKFCKHDRGSGVSDCKDYDCDTKNHYEWRGLCAQNQCGEVTDMVGEKWCAENGGAE